MDRAGGAEVKGMYLSEWTARNGHSFDGRDSFLWLDVDFLIEEHKIFSSKKKTRNMEGALRLGRAVRLEQFGLELTAERLADKSRHGPAGIPEK
jgi:hypothetical protein